MSESDGKMFSLKFEAIFLKAQIQSKVLSGLIN